MKDFHSQAARAKVDRSMHGGLSQRDRMSAQARLGRGVELTDLSININPFGPPKAVLAAVQGAEIERYPDSSATGVRCEYGRVFGVAPDRVVFGNGACELIWGLARYFSGRAGKVVVAEPTFSEFGRAALSCGLGVVEVWADSPEFQPDLDRLEWELRREQAACIYLCRPNNPTGQLLPWSSIEHLAATLKGAFLILDESFLSMSDGHADSARGLPANVIRVRSLTKDFGLPGLRLGYLIGPAEVARHLEEARPAWTTSAPAQAAALAALGELEFLDDSREALLQGRACQEQWLSSAGFRVLPSATVFNLVEVGNGADFRRRLLGEGVVVRDATSFGLPDHVRIGVGAPGAQERLRSALRSLGPGRRSKQLDA